MADLYAASRDVLHTVWGGVGGTEMYDKLRGQWYEPRVTVPRTLGHSHVLPPDMRNAEGAWNVLNRLTQKAAMRLRKQGFYAMGMAVHVQGRRVVGYKAGGQQEASFCETQDTAFLLRVLARLWGRGLALFPRPVAVGMTLFGLVPASQHTPTLFETKFEHPFGASDAPGLSSLASAPRAPLGDRARLSATIDTINRQYGKNALYFASAHGALNHAPMRIAFNRIPDIETER
jgi:DNA polymerase-4